MFLFSYLCKTFSVCQFVKNSVKPETELYNLSAAWKSASDLTCASFFVLWSVFVFVLMFLFVLICRPPRSASRCNVLLSVFDLVCLFSCVSVCLLKEKKCYFFLSVGKIGRYLDNDKTLPRCSTNF